MSESREHVVDVRLRLSERAATRLHMGAERCGLSADEFAARTVVEACDRLLPVDRLTPEFPETLNELARRACVEGR